MLFKSFKDCSYLVLTTDGTTGPDGVGYWSVTISGMQANFELCHSILACVPAYANHTGRNLAKVVLDVLESVGLDKDKVVAVVTDEGGGAPCIADCFPNAVPIFCAAHLLQTTLRHAFDDTYETFPCISTVLTVCKSLARQYNQSCVSRAEIQVLQAELSDSVASLKQEVVTRWLSQWNTFDSVAQNESAIKIWINERALDSPEFQHYNPETFWPLLHCLVDILRPFKEVTEAFSIEKKPTLHLVVDLVDCLHQHLSSAKDGLSQRMLNDKARSSLLFLLDSLDKALTTKFENWDDLELAAYALNPTFRSPTNAQSKHYFELGVAAIKRLLSTGHKGISFSLRDSTLATSASRSTPSQALSFLQLRELQRRPILQTASMNELDEYLAVPQANPLEAIGDFWNRMVSRLPRLTSLATLVFSIPCSQTASEREFSLLRLMCTHLRGRLAPETVNMLITCAAFINRRNADSESTQSQARTDTQISADAARVSSLLRSNKKRIRERAMQIDSAAKLAQLNFPSILSNLRLPSFFEPEDIDQSLVGAINDRLLFEVGDGTISGDEDYVYELRPAKAHRGPSDETPYGRTPSPGRCKLIPCQTSKKNFSGEWKCTTDAKPTPLAIFGQHLQFVEFLDDSLDIDDDETEYLKPSFTFRLTKKGAKKFTGRRGFVSAVGELILFGD